MTTGTDLVPAIRGALERRTAWLEQQTANSTDILRLWHGVAEGRPGITVDRYGPVLLVQTFSDPLAPGELDTIAGEVESAIGTPLTPVWNHRGAGTDSRALTRNPTREYARYAPLPAIGDAADLLREAEGYEAGLRYDVRPRHEGRDPLLFVDLRSARRKIREVAQGKSVLNLFAYTCGVGVAALAGGARESVNVDFSSRALAIGRANARRNGTADRFTTVHEDVIAATRQWAGLPLADRRGGRQRRPSVELSPREFDLVVLDPPTFARGRFGTVDIVRDYPTIFKPALLATRPGGSMLATNHSARVSWPRFQEILERAAAKAGRPTRTIERVMPDEDIPSFDDDPPLKIAWIELAE